MMTLSNLNTRDVYIGVAALAIGLYFFEWYNVAATAFMIVGIFTIWDLSHEKILSQDSWIAAETVQNQLLSEDQHFTAGKISAVTLVVSIFMGSWFIFCVSLPFCLYNKWLIKKIYHAIH